MLIFLKITFGVSVFNQIRQKVDHFKGFYAYELGFYRDFRTI